MESYREFVLLAMLCVAMLALHVAVFWPFWVLNKIKALPILRRFFVEPAVTVTTYSVTIDYTRSVVELSKTANLEAMNGYLEEELPSYTEKGSGVVQTEVSLLRFNQSMKTNDVIKEMEKRGLRRANLQEMLTFASSCPQETSGLARKRGGAMAVLAEYWNSPTWGPRFAYIGTWPRGTKTWWGKFVESYSLIFPHSLFRYLARLRSRLVLNMHDLHCPWPSQTEFMALPVTK